MGILGRLERWLDSRKPSNRKIETNPFSKRRKDLTIIEYKCPSCNNHKAFVKNSVAKCTKCKTKFKV